MNPIEESVESKLMWEGIKKVSAQADAERVRGYDLFMTQTAVTAGEAVTAGQVIGYVGSTGDSTGSIFILK